MVLSGDVQSSSSLLFLPHCQLALALGKEGLSHRAQQNKCFLKSQPSYPNAGLPSAPTLIHLSYLPRARAGHSPSWLTRSRAGDRRKLAESTGLKGGHGHGVPAVGWPVWSEMWRGGVVHHGAGSTDGFPIPGCVTPRVLQQRFIPAEHRVSRWVSAPVGIKGVISSARVKYPLCADI